MLENRKEVLLPKPQKSEALVRPTEILERNRLVLRPNLLLLTHSRPTPPPRSGTRDLSGDTVIVSLSLFVIQCRVIREDFCPSRCLSGFVSGLKALRQVILRLSSYNVIQVFKPQFSPAV